MSDDKNVLDAGRSDLPLSLTFHGKPGQTEVEMTLSKEHLAAMGGTKTAELLNHTSLHVHGVESSHRGMVSGLSVFDGPKGAAIKTNSGGALISNADGNVHMCHVPLGTVTPSNPGIVYFTDQPTDADALHAQYLQNVARCKYDPSHKPDHGVTKIVPDGDLEPVYIVPTGTSTPLGVLCASNPSLNKKDGAGKDIYFTRDGVQHHVLEEDNYKEGISVLDKHLKPKKEHPGLTLKLKTPNPPVDEPYKVNVHMTLKRPQFVGSDGNPIVPDHAELPSASNPLVAATVQNTAVGEIPGHPGKTGNFSEEKA